MNQWNRSESLEVNPHACGQLIYVKGSKNKQWRKDSLLNKWCWENWTAPCKRMNKIRTLNNTIHKKNSKWIKDLNVRPDTMKLLQGNKGRTFFDINGS